MEKKLSREEAWELLTEYGEVTAILCRGTSGVLALSGDDDYPYAVPISFVFDGAKLYFHCAKGATNWTLYSAVLRHPSASSTKTRSCRKNTLPISEASLPLGRSASSRMRKRSGRQSRNWRKNIRQMKMPQAAGKKSTGSGKRCVCLKCASTT